MLDTETTGLKQSSRVVQTAVLSLNGSVLLDTLINPGEPTPPKVSAIHGIYNDMVGGAPIFTQVWPQLLPLFVNCKGVLAYNSEFGPGHAERRVRAGRVRIARYN